MTKVEGHYKHSWVICHELCFRKLSWRCQFSRYPTYILLATIVIWKRVSFIGTFVILFIDETLRLHFLLKTSDRRVFKIYSYIYLYMIIVVFFLYLVYLKRHEIISRLILVYRATVTKREHANFLEMPLIPRRQIVDQCKFKPNK